MWEPLLSQFAKKESQIACVTTTNAVSANRHAMNAMQLPCAVRSIEQVTRQVYGQEDDLADRLIATVNVAADDMVGNGLTGHVDADVYPMDTESRKLFALSTTEKQTNKQHTD